MTAAFKGSQLAVGFFMFVFGLVDRFEVKLPCSYLLLPIWIGILVVITGFCGIFIGNFRQRRGFLGPNMVSGLKAMNILCAALAFYSFNCYGGSLMALNIANVAINPEAGFPLKRGITSILMILSIAEMFCGVWMALMNNEGMYLGSTQPIQHQVPGAMSYSVQQGPRHTAPPTLDFSTQPQYQQQQQDLSQQVPNA